MASAQKNMPSFPQDFKDILIAYTTQLLGSRPQNAQDVCAFSAAYFEKKAVLNEQAPIKVSPFPEDFKNVLVPFATRLLKSQPENLQDIYAFSTAYFEKKLEDRQKTTIVDKRQDNIHFSETEDRSSEDVDELRLPFQQEFQEKMAESEVPQGFQNKKLNFAQTLEEMTRNRPNSVTNVTLEEKFLGELLKKIKSCSADVPSIDEEESKQQEKKNLSCTEREAAKTKTVKELASSMVTSLKAKLSQNMTKKDSDFSTDTSPKPIKAHLKEVSQLNANLEKRGTSDKNYQELNKPSCLKSHDENTEVLQNKDDIDDSKTINKDKLCKWKVQMKNETLTKVVEEKKCLSMRDAFGVSSPLEIQRQEYINVAKSERETLVTKNSETFLRHYYASSKLGKAKIKKGCKTECSEAIPASSGLPNQIFCRQKHRYSTAPQGKKHLWKNLLAQRYW